MPIVYIVVYSAILTLLQFGICLRYVNVHDSDIIPLRYFRISLLNPIVWLCMLQAVYLALENPK